MAQSSEDLKRYFREISRKQRKGKKQFTCLLDEELVEEFNAYLEEQGISKRKWVEDHIKKALGK